MHVRDLVTMLVKENKISPRPRVMDAVYRVPLNDDADARLLNNQTMVLEDREALDVTGGKGLVIRYVLGEWVQDI